MPDAETIEPSAPPPRRPRRKLRHLLAIVLVVILSPFLVFALWSRVQASRLERALDAVEARGESVDVRTYAPGPVTPEQQQASALYDEFGRLTQDVRPARFAAAAAAVHALSSLTPQEAARDPRLAVLRNAEATYTGALDLLERAAALGARGVSGDRTQSFVGYGTAAPSEVRIALRAFSGDGEGAARALVALLRLRSVLLPIHAPYSGRTSDSLRLILTFTRPALPVLEALQREYAAIETDPDVEARMKYNRARFLSVVLPGQAGGQYTDRRPTPIDLLLARAVTPLWTAGVIAELRHYEAAIAAARLPWPGRLDAALALTEGWHRANESRAPKRSRWDALRRPWRENIAAAEAITLALSAAESLTRARASVAALAVTRYQRAHGGGLPGALADLVPEYLSGRLTDPYTGRELFYRRDGKGYRIYGAGANRRDDGGAWELTSDLVTTQRGAAMDIGVAVPAPASALQ